jgi:hypothetical protein
MMTTVRRATGAVTTAAATLLAVRLSLLVVLMVVVVAALGFAVLGYAWWVTNSDARFNRIINLVNSIRGCAEAFTPAPAARATKTPTAQIRRRGRPPDNVG